MHRLCLGRALLALLLMLPLVGCGSEDPTSEGDGSANNDKPLLPWATGNSWTYRVTDNDVSTEKTTTIGPEELVGGSGPNAGKLAHRVETRKGESGADETTSWQALEGERVIRYREQAFGAQTEMLQLEEHWDAYKLHIDGSDAHTLSGAGWLEEYVETKLPVGGTPTTAAASDFWSVMAVGEKISVPAGTFEDAIKLQKVGGSIKVYWYVRGVGKVMESGGQLEELVSYEVGP